MIEYLKANAGTVIISGALFSIGIILGVICQEDENGIYLTANYSDGTSIFRFGKTKENISDIDLMTMSEVDSHILTDKLKELSANNHISRQLRDMVKNSEGPFERIPVDLVLHFANDNRLTGNVSKACKDTPIYNNSIVAYEIDNNTGIQYQTTGIMGLKPMWEQQMLSKCTHGNSNAFDIWVSREHVENWLGPINQQTNSIIVKANIVASSL